MIFFPFSLDGLSWERRTAPSQAQILIFMDFKYALVSCFLLILLANFMNTNQVVSL